MFRKTIQILACLSVLLAGGSHSLHMARDSYRRPSASDLDAAAAAAANSDENSLESMPIGHHRIHQLQQQQHPQRYQSLPPGGAASDDAINRQQQHLQHNAPIALQELFAGTATLDIRLEQQQQQQNQRQLNDDINNIIVDEQQPQQHKRGNGEEAIGPDNPSPLPQTSGGVGGKPNMPPPPIPHGIASQLMLRSARGQRNYDVPQIGEFSIFFNKDTFLNILQSNKMHK